MEWFFGAPAPTREAKDREREAKDRARELRQDARDRERDARDRERDARDREREAGERAHERAVEALDRVMQRGTPHQAAAAAVDAGGNWSATRPGVVETHWGTMHQDNSVSEAMDRGMEAHRRGMEAHQRGMQRGADAMARAFGPGGTMDRAFGPGSAFDTGGFEWAAPQTPPMTHRSQHRPAPPSPRKRAPSPPPHLASAPPAPTPSAPPLPPVEAAAEGAECIVCLAAKKDHVLVPCGHAYCGPCAVKQTACAVCRSQVREVIKAFL